MACCLPAVEPTRNIGPRKGLDESRVIRIACLQFDIRPIRVIPARHPGLIDIAGSGNCGWSPAGFSSEPWTPFSLLSDPRRLPGVCPVLAEPSRCAPRTPPPSCEGTHGPKSCGSSYSNEAECTRLGMYARQGRWLARTTAQHRRAAPYTPVTIAGATVEFAVPTRVPDLISSETFFFKIAPCVLLGPGKS